MPPKRQSTRVDVLQGTLDLMVLRTLEAMGPLHGFGLARRIEQVSGGTVLLNQGTIYAALVRLQHRGLISARWGTSDNNRRAKFYALTRAGQRKLEEGVTAWERIAAVMARFLAARTS
ncbi:MAG: PadR family transcriptional regulator [Vicinamibacterales bacterium]